MIQVGYLDGNAFYPHTRIYEPAVPDFPKIIVSIDGEFVGKIP